MKKIVAAILLIAVMCAVLVLTFQGPKETVFLSELVRGWAVKIGYKEGPLQFRSDIHLVEYFIVGLAVSFLGLTMGWKGWIPVATCCGFGLLDETIKIVLPTREFGAADWVKDCIGALIAVGVVYGVNYLVRGKSDCGEP